jgi:hypothetical protein
MKGTIVISILLLALLIVLGVAAILGWTVDSRDGSQTLSPLEGTRPDNPMIAAVPTTAGTAVDGVPRRSLLAGPPRLPTTRRSP